MSETRQFQAYTKKLLDLMIHSIYAHKDVFLRELISNASDAIDKVRFEALTNPDLLEGDGDFKIKLVPNEEAHTLTISDNGVGMTYDEVIEHIGTIARSGSEAFADRLKTAGGDAATPDLIGQFGVGFYSAFMVAKKVELWTRKAGADHGVHWSSHGDGEYTIEKTDAGRRGTTITLHLRDRDAPHQDDSSDDHEVFNEDSYSDPWTLKRIVKKYSDFIAFPIVMDTKKWEDGASDAATDGAEGEADGEDKQPAPKVEKLVEETLNSSKALWTRQPSAVEKDEYTEFYKHISKDWNPPSETLHFHVEGQQEWTGLLFFPEKAPFDLYSREPRRGLQLYIKKVFIAEDVKELVPEHFRFIKGLVDSADLPLNVSRETVQQDRLMPLIKRRIGNKLVAHCKDLLEKDRPRYEKLWEEFGMCIKEGFHYEPGQKDKLADILLVKTTLDSKWSTLAEVAGRKKEGQKALFYLTGDKLETLQAAPQLEVFKKRDVEVILLPEAVDEIMVGTLNKYGELDLKSAARGEIDDLPEASTPEQKAETEGSFAKLTEKLAKLLAESVSKVRISERLTDSAVCLVADQDGMSSQLERMLQAMGQPVPQQKRILELNPDHSLIQALRDLAERDTGDEKLTEYAEMLLDQALLAEGATLKNPARFAQRVASAMTAAVAH